MLAEKTHIYLSVEMVKMAQAKEASCVITHTALADHSSRAEIASGYEVPAGKGGEVDYIEIGVYTVATTGVVQGGLFEFENGSVDWKPLEFYSPMEKVLTTTGHEQKPLRIPVKKPLPENSVIHVYFTANAAAGTTWAYARIHWIIGGSGGVQTYADSQKGAASAVVTEVKAHVTHTIPAAKGGRAVAYYCVMHDTPETIVAAGGRIALRCSSADWNPTEFFILSSTGITTIAAYQMPVVIPLDHDLPARSKVYADLLAHDNNSQYMMASLVWEG